MIPEQKRNDRLGQPENKMAATGLTCRVVTSSRYPLLTILVELCWWGQCFLILSARVSVGPAEPLLPKAPVFGIQLYYAQMLASDIGGCRYYLLLSLTASLCPRNFRRS